MLAGRAEQLRSVELEKQTNEVVARGERLLCLSGRRILYKKQQICVSVGQGSYMKWPTLQSTNPDGAHRLSRHYSSEYNDRKPSALHPESLERSIATCDYEVKLRMP